MCEICVDDREKKIETKFGVARLNANGYYVITSSKEGNNMKYLHRLIYEDYYAVTLLEDIEIHHKDENRLNNDIKNLVAISKSNHTRLHKKGVSFSDEHRKKIAEAITGCKRSEETRNKVSEAKKGLKHSDETRNKMSEAHKDVPLSENHKRNVSIATNTSGIRNVYKHKTKQYKKGFKWEYSFYENGKRKIISSGDIQKLKEKVLEKGLVWEEY